MFVEVLQLAMQAASIAQVSGTMPRSKKRNAKILPVSSNEVRHVVGPVNDDTVSAILKSEPTREERSSSRAMWAVRAARWTVSAIR